MDKKWYEVFFENYADDYEQEVFTKGTLQECDFIEKELAGDKSLKILDIGCGTGRHSIELARRGYDVTGVDLSESLLNRAKENARKAGAEVNFILKDARLIEFDQEFDVALVLCEGGLGLMENDAENYKILTNIHRSLKTGGKTIITLLNALFPLTNDAGAFFGAEDYAFDLKTFYAELSMLTKDEDGNSIKIRASERNFTPPEISRWMHDTGFRYVEILGCMPGEFSRERPISKNDVELMAIAVK
jgi:2-polyprenyl-3-methyl-5-hydroxy-6-metoxy-1,4-benzoquinol methylase